MFEDSTAEVGKEIDRIPDPASPETTTNSRLPLIKELLLGCERKELTFCVPVFSNSDTGATEETQGAVFLAPIKYDNSDIHVIVLPDRVMQLGLSHMDGNHPPQYYIDRASTEDDSRFSGIMQSHRSAYLKFSGADQRRERYYALQISPLPAGMDEDAAALTALRYSIDEAKERKLAETVPPINLDRTTTAAKDMIDEIV